MSRLFICTWLYAEAPGEESHYPQVGGVPSTPEFQAVYWRCVAVFFACARRQHPDASLVLFTNVSQLPVFKLVSMKALLDRWGVEVVQLPFRFAPPQGFHPAWRNQFYLFDIIRQLRKMCQPQDAALVLDSDCLWVRPADELVVALRRCGCLTYEVDELAGPDQDINGLTREDMGEIFAAMGLNTGERLPRYYGGEFFAATGEYLRLIDEAAAIAWEQTLERHSRGLKKCNEEAHLLSYIYHALDAQPRTGNPFIRRIWTSREPLKIDACVKDLELAIWHVPSEKGNGIGRLFAKVANAGSRFWTVSLGAPFQRFIGWRVGVPHRSLLRYRLERFRDRLTWRRLSNRVRRAFGMQRLP